MTTRPLKHVLVVDDDAFTRHDVCAAFKHYSDDAGSEFRFVAEAAESIHEAVGKVRAQRVDTAYDVIVLDLAFDEDGRTFEGLRIADALGICRRLGQAIPVEIVFSGYADVRTSVQVMRHGAWDVIDKHGDDPDVSPFRLVVESAVHRLKALDLQQNLNATVLPWLQRHIIDLQKKYGGLVVAIWHDPSLEVVADGRDVFELETRLDAWRKEHPDWMYPFVVQIPGGLDLTPRQEG